MQTLVTVPTISKGLSEIGVKNGAKLMVHCSLSSFGHVQGGAQTIIEALLSHVGNSGTVVMPTLTHGRFDPSEWSNPPVPQALWDRIRFETPLFHPQKTPVDCTMSVIYELFRTWPGVIRTNHPHSSIAVWGAERERVASTHKLEERFGNSSPLGVLYALDAQVLFLGTGYETNTCFHLAEYRVPNPPRRKYKIIQQRAGEKALVQYEDVDTNSNVFGKIGVEFEANQDVQTQRIGAAPCKLFSLRAAVDFATDWLIQNENQ